MDEYDSERRRKRFYLGVAPAICCLACNPERRDVDTTDAFQESFTEAWLSSKRTSVAFSLDRVRLDEHLLGEGEIAASCFIENGASAIVFVGPIGERYESLSVFLVLDGIEASPALRDAGVFYNTDVGGASHWIPDVHGSVIMERAGDETYRFAIDQNGTTRQGVALGRLKRRFVHHLGDRAAEAKSRLARFPGAPDAVE